MTQNLFRVIYLLRFLLPLFFAILTSALFSKDEEPDPGIITADSLMEAGQYEEAIEMYREYVESQGKIKDSQKENISEYYSNIALCYYKLESFNNAIEWFLKALDLQEEMGDHESVANTLNNIGLNYKKLGNYDKAIEYYEQAVRIDEESGNVMEMAKTLNNIGMIYRARAKYDKAIEYFEKSLDLRKSTNDKVGISKSLNSLGLVYTELKKYDEALIFFRESLHLEDSLNDPYEAAISYNNIGRVYFYKNQYDTALAYFEKCLEFHKKNNNPDQVALAYNNMGKVYLALLKYKDAETAFSAALALFDKLGMQGEKATVLANLARIKQETGKSEEALHLLDSSTMIANKINLRTQLQQNYLSYSILFSGIKDFEKSLDYYKKYIAEKDSVFSRDILGQLNEFQVKYEKEKDLKLILQLEKENLQKTIQRNAYLITGLGVILIALFIILYFRQKASHIKFMSDQKILQLEEEKKLIAAQLLVEGQELERKRVARELHDGLGVLLSATKMQFSVIHDNSPENRELIEKASRMLEQASGDVRKISHNMMPGLLTQLGFYEAVEDLFEQIDDRQDLNAVCSISGNRNRLAENKEIMLYRIVQEMVNNTIKHARAKNIELHIRVGDDRLDLVYSDDGKGFDFDKKFELNSLGLKSIKSRVDFLNGRFEVSTSPGNGVKYSLQVPS